jgi:raffinose/stachyose/melibiose transport system permease protein
MGLLIAVVLSQIVRFQLFFRSLFFVPYVMATVVNAAIWQNLLNPSIGISAGLDKIGIHWLDNVYFLGNEHLALPTVAFVDMWHFTGFLVVLFLAAIQAVDPELYNAARVDGATRLRQFWHVTLPGIRPTLTFIMLMTVIWSFFTFEYVYILTGGGPAGSTDLLSTLLIRNALSNNLAGYATAQALVMAIGGGIISLSLTIFRKQGWEV